VELRALTVRRVRAMKPGLKPELMPVLAFVPLTYLPAFPVSPRACSPKRFNPESCQTKHAKWHA